MIRIPALLLALLLSSVTSCKKQQQRTEEPRLSTGGDAVAPAEPKTASKPDPATAAVRDKLPGASVVRDDLKNKNYSKAVEGLLVLRPFAVKDDQWMEYRELSSEVV